MTGRCSAAPAAQHSGLGVLLFTCCPNCETVFKVGAKHLQQAAGKVRCGQCEFSFNALSNIQESASEAAANLKALAEKGEDTATPPDDLPEEEVGDPEQRIPWQLVSETESSSLDTGGAAPNDDDEVVLVEDAEAFEAAVLATIHATESKAWESSGPHFTGNDDDADSSPDEPDEVQTVQTEPTVDDDDTSAEDPGQEKDPDQPSVDFLERLAEDAGEEASLEDIDVDDEDSDESAVDDSDSDVEEIWLGEITLESAEKDELEFDVPGDQVDSVFMEADEETAAPEAGDEKEDQPGAWSFADPFDPNSEGAEEIVLASEDDLDSEAAETEPESEPKPGGTGVSLITLTNRYRRPASIAVAVALAFLLLTQLTHYFRYQILASGLLGPLLETVYSGLGIPLTKRWDLDAYDIRRTIGVGSETGNGIVEISAILTNRATIAQPYPILRLIFTDQRDKALAIRDLNANEYLQTDPGEQARMAAGDQVAVVDYSGFAETTRTMTCDNWSNNNNLNVRGFVVNVGGDLGQANCATPRPVACSAPAQ